MRVRLRSRQWREPTESGSRLRVRGDVFEVSPDVGEWLIRSRAAAVVQDPKPKPRRKPVDE